MDIETRLIRQGAYIAAMESLLLSIFDHMPNKQKIIDAFVLSEIEVYDQTFLDESFSEEELDAFRTARQKLHAQLSGTGS